MNNMSDEERARMERTAEDAARTRDRALKRALEDYERTIGHIETEMATKIDRAKAHYAAAREAAHLHCERTQEAMLNFLEVSHDRKKAATCGGLDLPYLHSSNTFSRKGRRQMAEEAQ